jgi:hypothetical protein
LTTRPNRSVLRENRKRRIENDGHHISGKPVPLVVLPS